MTPAATTRPRLRAALVGLALALASCPAAGPAPDAPAGPATRVVSLAPALTATLVELGAADRLVGVTRYCDAPGVQVVGDLEPRLEVVVAQRPDLVVMGEYGSQSGAAEKLRALGLHVRTWPLVTLADMRRATLALGGLVARDEAARALERRLGDALAALAKAGEGRRAVRVLIVYDVQPGFVLTTGGGDHVSELVALGGGVNVASPGPVTARLGLEEVVARAPELVLHVAPDPRFPDDAAALSYWRALLPAMPAEAVRVWPDDRLARNGPHLAEVAPRLAALLRDARR
ncbi:MAG: ABC transporter substrate-binding protein [Deltaproteobacteria bacterium]|nr:ABC transporter substrate-binding protein [Deltaproteobacteria bacterium]